VDEESTSVTVVRLPSLFLIWHRRLRPATHCRVAATWATASWAFRRSSAYADDAVTQVDDHNSSLGATSVDSLCRESNCELLVVRLTVAFSIENSIQWRHPLFKEQPYFIPAGQPAPYER
jgi:hypothetical protein